jgi:hypothetical protein
MAPRFPTILTGRNLPKIRQSRDSFQLTRSADIKLNERV